MSMSKPKVPAYKPPAEKPERQVDVEPEDVQLGDEASQDTTKQRGKRSLMRPSGTTGGANAGGSTGTGLAV